MKLTNLKRNDENVFFKQTHYLFVLLLILAHYANATKPTQRFLDSVALKWVPDKRIANC